jgi:phage shock protein PspC (stress-responsive transcriptional regulator)
MAAAGPTAMHTRAEPPRAGERVPEARAVNGGTHAATGLVRYPEHGILGGVCAGIARSARLDPLLVRFLMLIVVFAAGFGVAIYALAWAFIPIAPDSRGRESSSRFAWRGLLMALTVGGMFVAVHLSGFRFGDAVIWPVVVGACAAALAWRLATGARPLPRLRRNETASARGSGGNTEGRSLAAWVVLVAFACAALLHTFGLMHELGKEIVAGAIIAATLACWSVRGPCASGAASPPSARPASASRSAPSSRPICTTRSCRRSR